MSALTRKRRRAVWLGGAALALVMTVSDRALAAGGAYAVEDAEVEAPGSCKVEAWGSFADNTDRIAVVSPACVVNLVKPIEIGVEIARARADRTWGTSGDFKGKINILPVETGKLGIAVVGGLGFDLLAGEHASASVLVPFTYPITEQFRLNVNVGWLWERDERQSFLTWGAGFEWNVMKPVMLIAEIFGQAGHGANDPRFQAGIRITPREWFDIDVIYGRNITGEDANWITLGLNLRFDVASK
jgi:hypothetical protein